MLQQLGYELAVLTPTGWIDMYRRRHSLRQQLKRGPLCQEQGATLADSLALLANQLAAPSSLTSKAGQISVGAWAVSICYWFCSFAPELKLITTGRPHPCHQLPLPHLFNIPHILFAPTFCLSPDSPSSESSKGRKHLDHGPGARVQPDRQVLLLPCGPTSRAKKS